MKTPSHALPGSRKRKTWQEKLGADHGLPKVITMEGKLRERIGEGTMAIPAPKEVDAYMKKVPLGKLTTIEAIKKKIAAKHDTTTACGITTGIFAWIAAHAADEARLSGTDVEEITPYWRTLKNGGELNAKYPGGIEAIKELIEGEGHEVYQKGKRWFVRDFVEAIR